MVHHYKGCTVCNHCRSGWSQLCQEAAGAGLRQQRPWRPRQLSEGAGLHPGAAARRIVLRHRRGDLLRHRHRLWRAAPHPDFRQRHDRDLRPGPGRAVGDAAGGGDGGARHRARRQRGAARTRQGIRRRRDRQPALQRPGRRDQGSDARLWRRVHPRHLEPAGRPHRRGARHQGVGHDLLCRRAQPGDDRRQPRHAAGSS